MAASTGFSIDSDLVTDIIDGTGYVADVAIPASFQAEVSRKVTNGMVVAEYVKAMLNVASKNSKNAILDTYKAGLFNETEVAVILDVQEWLAAKEENELVWWKLNVALRSDVEEAFYATLSDNSPNDRSVTMLERGMEAASRIVVRNDDTEDFYSDMCCYYLNAQTYGFHDGGSQAHFDRMVAFEAKFNRIIRKVVRAA
jgi:hypothetical protein